MRICPRCQKEFAPKTDKHKWCTWQCKSASRNKGTKEINDKIAADMASRRDSGMKWAAIAKLHNRQPNHVIDTVRRWKARSGSTR
jgi:hypothetical protein